MATEGGIPMAALTFGFSAGAIARTASGAYWDPWGPLIGMGGALLLVCATALFFTHPKPVPLTWFYPLATIFCVGLFLVAACGGLALAEYGAANH